MHGYAINERRSERDTVRARGIAEEIARSERRVREGRGREASEDNEERRIEGEGDHGEGMKREGRSKMAWKERCARGGGMDKTGACSEKN